MAMTLDPLAIILTLIIYGAGLFVAYRRGAQDTRRRYSDLINRLHKQYNLELNKENSLLLELWDMEKSKWLSTYLLKIETIQGEILYENWVDNSSNR